MRSEERHEVLEVCREALSYVRRTKRPIYGRPLYHHALFAVRQKNPSNSYVQRIFSGQLAARIDLTEGEIELRRLENWDDVAHIKLRDAANAPTLYDFVPEENYEDRDA